MAYAQNMDFAFSDAVYYQGPESMIMPMKNHESHPNFGRLCMLVFEAVMEVVTVSLPGYIVARMGMFDAGAQKFVANLNMTLFTPCLIFSKLAKQLSGDKLLELIIIPVILLVQTAVSYGCAKVVTRLFKLNKKPQNNFVTAMAVFGNSNSLPLSLVISLSHTISGLHWAKIPGDNDSEVAARGILYLLIFSQLGQALRWSWGMNSLLKPIDSYTPAERGEIPRDDEAFRPYRDESPRSSRSNSLTASSEETRVNKSPKSTALQTVPNGHDQAARQRTANDDHEVDAPPPPVPPTAATASMAESANTYFMDLRRQAKAMKTDIKTRILLYFEALPRPIQSVFRTVFGAVGFVLSKIWACLNVPLAAILFSLLVAVIPPLKAFFFTEGTFVRNSITRAIEQSGGVAVPLILVVLGANLARNTLPDEGERTPEKSKEERNMLIASLLCRMVLPTVIMAPILAIMAKFLPISIFDDPIFLIVCFLLTGAPSALQLAQMCQVNNIFIGAVSRLLFHSYVVWILPSTLVLVMIALEVVEWVDDNGGK